MLRDFGSEGCKFKSCRTHQIGLSGFSSHSDGDVVAVATLRESLFFERYVTWNARGKAGTLDERKTIDTAAFKEGLALSKWIRKTLLESAKSALDFNKNGGTMKA
jgi:hypothetical protein